MRMSCLTALLFALAFPGMDARAVPTAVKAEVVAANPSAVTTGPMWNPNLPKLSGDASFLYAVHTYYSEGLNLKSRYAAILRRSANLAVTGWAEVARVYYPHQHPGIVTDVNLNLHLVFNCQRPGSTDVTCFQRGAGTTGNASRFYHLIFNGRHPDGSINFGTYANYNEYTAMNNGYLGLGTIGYGSTGPAPGTTFWSLETWAPDGPPNIGWQRVVQWSFDNGGPHQSGSWPNIPQRVSKLSYDLPQLYPIMAGHNGSSEPFLIFTGEFRMTYPPGSNAAYEASLLHTGPFNPAPLALKYVATPASGTCTPADLKAYPNDVAFDNSGILFLLTHHHAGCNQPNTEILRFSNGVNDAPVVTPIAPPAVGIGTYSKLQFSSDGTLWILPSQTVTNGTVVVGASTDRGMNWTWYSLPITGITTANKRFLHFTVVKPYTAPLVYNSNRILFLFEGDNIPEDNNWTSYLGWIDL